MGVEFVDIPEATRARRVELATAIAYFDDE